ncbi:MAG: glycoside hydrolase family 43 protein [Bryobacterales bacterium]|nr:glycoside hydrolase family 43 protein [Bryobacterales bacterium]
MRRREMIAVLPSLISPSLLRSQGNSSDTLIFAFFRKNGEDGLYLATSQDGLRWTPLHGDRPLVAPQVGESKLMRDPSIVRGPDGRFHMVWTTAWEGQTIGYARSTDLMHWSPQQAIPVMAHEPGATNCWAPEIYYDQAQREFVVVWASTVKGRFPDTLSKGERERNHRLYAFRTKDFETIGKTELFYDPGFLAIDAAIFKPDHRYAMVVKNETRFPPAKNLFLTFAPTLRGPWSMPSKPFSGEEWAEGPSPIRIGDYWVCYFDRYRIPGYGAMRSRNLEDWEDITAECVFPAGMRHGTAFRAPRAVVDAIG